MDWERQRQVLRDYPRSERRRFSYFTKDVERVRREKQDLWNLRQVMREWLYAWETDFKAIDSDWFDYDLDLDEDERGAWKDPDWSVTLSDLIR
jgi:hypothetical protein